MPRVRTPSGGVHLYFLGTDQCNGSLHHEHVDFRCCGGYVLVPPSRVVTDSYAGVYRWERRAAPTTRVDWQAVRELLRPPTPVITPPRTTPNNRLLRHCHVVVTDGDSYRMKRAGQRAGGCLRTS